MGENEPGAAAPAPARVPDETIMAYAAEKAYGTGGVYGMGMSLSASAITKNLLGQDKKTRGVRVVYDEEKGYTIDIFLIAAYGSNIPETAWNVQKSVSDGLKDEYGIVPDCINIHIQGVHAEQTEREGEND